MRRGLGRFVGVCATTAALTLLIAPMTAIIRPACTQCPPDCPMHARSHGRHVKRGCHEAREGARNPRHCQPQKGFTRPGCGHAQAGAPITIARAILPVRTATWVLPPTRLVAEDAPALRLRDADPPESPPPILAV